LYGDGIGDGDAGHRPPEAPVIAATLEHDPSCPGGNYEKRCDRSQRAKLRTNTSRVCGRPNRHFGRMRINAERRHSATSLLS
jgi:hypothetical protein